MIVTRKIIKNAIHNLGQGITHLAHFYQINSLCNACMHTQAARNF